jgi:hypothetical protein
MLAATRPYFTGFLAPPQAKFDKRAVKVTPRHARIEAMTAVMKRDDRH